MARQKEIDPAELKWLVNWIAVLTHLENMVARADGVLYFSKQRVSDAFKAQGIIEKLVARVDKAEKGALEGALELEVEKGKPTRNED